MRVDPYRAWLGIRDPRRPLSAYALLNLEPGESDPERIAAAAARQLALLNNQRLTAPPLLWSRVYEELERAIGVLTDPIKKAHYDMSLTPHADTRHGFAGDDAAEALNASGSRSAAVVPCAGCGQENPATLRYCSHCGTSLRHACPHCQTQVSVLDSFCGTCGSNLAAMRREQRARAESRLANCQRWLSERLYERSVEGLRALAQDDNPLLADVSQEAQRLLAEAQRSWDEARAQAAMALQAAEVSLAARDYEEVVRQLSEIPPPLRDQRAESLLQTAAATLDEIRHLRAQCASVQRDEELPAALHAAERLLELLPEDREHRQRYEALQQRARKAAQRKRDALCQAAQRAIARHDYAAAQQILAQINPAVRTPAVEQLARHVQELAFLERDVRTSPYVDEVLPHVAARLQRLAPEDPRPKQWQAEMQRRQAAAGGIARWARPPEQPWITAPVEWLTGLPRLQLTQENGPALLRQHPGALALACGLALQGLNRASINIQFALDDAQQSPLKRVQSLLHKRTHDAAWGLDIGSSAIKAVRLEVRGSEPVLTACALVPLESETGDPDSDAVRGALRRLQEQCDLSDGRLCINLPAARVLGRFLVVPAAAAGRRLDELMRYEAGHNIPFPLSDVCWSYHVPQAEIADRKRATEVDNDSLAMQRVILQAAKRFHVQQRLELLHGTGLRPEIVQSDCLALHNFVAYALRIGDHGEAQSQGAGGPQPVVAGVEVGAQGTNVVFSWSGGVWFRSFGLGGNAFTQALVRQYHLTWQQAELLKRQPAKAELLSRWDQALHAEMAAWGTQLRQTIEMFQAAHRAEPLRVSSVYCLGGGAALHGLLRYLRTGR